MNNPQIPAVLKDRLGLYSAMAASVGIVGTMTGTASADVVYSGPVNIPVTSAEDVAIDVTNDGFSNLIFSVGTFSGQPLLTVTSGTNFDYILIYASPFNYPYAINFDAGALIPSVDAISDPVTTAATLVYANLGAFQEPDNNGFLGAYFPLVQDVDDPNTPEIDPQPTVVDFLAGYVQLADVTDNGLTIVSYAFESDPRSGIVTGSIPEPGSLAALAVGALAMVRRGRRNAA